MFLDFLKSLKNNDRFKLSGGESICRYHWPSIVDRIRHHLSVNPLLCDLVARGIATTSWGVEMVGLDAATREGLIKGKQTDHEQHHDMMTTCKVV